MTYEVKHLLAGYATGTLTPEESSALMRAALEDQEIFDAMADDEALRRYLAEPSFRRDLLKATAPRSSLTWWAGAASGVAAAACLVAVYLWVSRPVPVVSLGQMAVARAPLPLEPPRAQLTPAPAKAAPATARPKRAEAVASAPRKMAEEPTVPPATEVLARQLNKQVEALNGAPPAPSYTPRSANSVAMFAMPRPARAPITAHITDINAAILTLNVGSNAGVKVGDRLEILHENAPIGEIVITSAEPAFSVGRYAGATPPQIGDLAAPPRK